jgi:hypothetical protein
LWQSGAARKYKSLVNVDGKCANKEEKVYERLLASS